MKIQGIKKYCDKEGYIVEFFRNKNIFEDINGCNIKDIYSQVRFNVSVKNSPYLFIKTSLII